MRHEFRKKGYEVRKKEISLEAWRKSMKLESSCFPHIKNKILADSEKPELDFWIIMT